MWRQGVTAPKRLYSEKPQRRRQNVLLPIRLGTKNFDAEMSAHTHIDKPDRIRIVAALYPIRLTPEHLFKKTA